MVRLETNRRAKMPYRLLSIAQLLQRAPEIVVSVGVARIQAKRFGEMRDCLTVPALREEHIAQISVSPATARRVVGSSSIARRKQATAESSRPAL